MNPNQMQLLRIVTGAVAGVVGLFGVWILAAELFKPQLAYFPTGPEAAESFSTAQGASLTAAQIGMFRGGLWTMAAVAQAAPLLLVPATTESQQGEIAIAVETVLRTARLAPHDSRVWLILAGLEARLPQQSNRKAAEALKLSYYTAPNEFTLSPLRLSVAAQISGDEELQGLTRAEIQRIVLKRPDMKPAILAAYKSGIASSQKLFEAILKEVDPNLLAISKGAPR